MADQRFDEQEVGAILQRAAEIQSGLAPEADTPGVSLGELQKVAAEIGIDHDALERAAQEIRDKAPAKVGESRNSRTFDRTVQGVLAEDDWDDVVTQLRRFTGRAGTASQQGATREWTGGSDLASVTFTATSRNGKTRYRMLVDTSSASVLAGLVDLAGAAVLGPMTAALLKKSHVETLLVFLAAITVVLTIGLTSFLAVRSWRKKTQRNAAAVFDAIASNTLSPEPQPVALPEQISQVAQASRLL